MRTPCPSSSRSLLSARLPLTRNSPLRTMRMRPLRLRAPVRTGTLRAVAGAAGFCQRSLDATAHVASGSKSSRWVAQKQLVVTAKSVQIGHGIDHIGPTDKKQTGAPRMAPLKSALAVVAAMLVTAAGAQQSPDPAGIAR